jgi:hypothetical protein
MLIPITITVDPDELEIDSRVFQNGITTEYWGSVKTDTWAEVEIISVMYNDQEVELSDEAFSLVEEYVIKQLDDQHDY